MDDDDGTESFEINDADLEYAMNPGGRRRFQNKDQATYGIWAADQDSDEERPGKGPDNKRAKYTRPMAFVSGGVQKKLNVDKDDPESLKLGTYSSQRNEDGEAAIELNFDKKSKKSMKQNGAQVFAGMRSSATQSSSSDGVYSSVAQKMMAKMGYKKGEGLGKDKQGIVEPIEAKVRGGRGAVGAYGKEATGPKFGESAADAQKRLGAQGSSNWSENAENAVPKHRSSWKKSQKEKIKYRTMEDVVAESSATSSGAATSSSFSSQYSTTKVIDMTGRQQKVYSGYDSFSMKTRDGDEFDDSDEKRTVFDVPALVHNLNLLVELTEESIRRSDHQLTALKDQTTTMEYEAATTRKAVEEQENELKHVRDVFELLDGFSTIASPTLPQCRDLFKRLRTEFPHEYQLYSLESVAIPTVLPLIQSIFATWNPLADKRHGVEVIVEWRHILQKDATFGHNKTVQDEMSAYDRLIWEGVMPAIRKSTQSWDPRGEMHEMIELIEEWTPHLPVWIKENILEQLIVPKISERVNAWDPMTDEVPIHEWLVPWLVLLGDRIQAVMPPIRQKLARALKLWHPTDRSALATLRPWRDIWSSGVFTAFVNQNIVPKLSTALDEMQLDPSQNPQYPEWTACMEWIEMTHPDAIANIVTKYFFPRYYTALCQWLDSPGCDHNEVKRWCASWKTRIPPAIAAYPTVNENLRRAMIAIGRSMQGQSVSGLAPPPSQMAPPLSASSSASQMATHQMPPVAPTQTLSLKDALEMKAAMNGITYHPQKDRYKDGRQVYWFGTVSIYLDAGRIFVMDPVEFVWRPCGLEELLRMAHGAQR